MSGVNPGLSLEFLGTFQEVIRKGLETHDPKGTYIVEYYADPEGHYIAILKLKGAIKGLGKWIERITEENDYLVHLKFNRNRQIEVHLLGGNDTELAFINESLPSWIQRAERESGSFFENRNYPSKKQYETALAAPGKKKTEGGGKRVRSLRRAGKGTRKGRGSARKTSRAGRK